MGAPDDVALARGALADAVQSGAVRRALVGKLQRHLADVRRFVPEVEWAPIANDVGELRLNEEREEIARGVLKQRLVEGPRRPRKTSTTLA